MIESKSLDDSTVGFIYLGLSTVESESLEFSIEKCDTKKCTLIPRTIPILVGMKKILDFSMVESKSLDDSPIGVTYLYLSTVESKSLDFSFEKCDI